ncbi:MAG: Na+/H+ antiporter [Chloroflexi bacterium]|nr:Na+/H+ antiporter [Chloroflexota bacterium]
MEQDIELIEEIAFGLILLASLVGIGVRRSRMPYTVGLVLVGLLLAVGILQFAPTYARRDVRELLVPQLILALLVPPLVFEAAFHIRWGELRANLRPIVIFAIPGVIATMLLVGAVVAWGTELSFPVALVFGALIAATDPVAVVALFRSMGVPKRLQVLLEGESLFNDGTAIVLYTLMLGLAAQATAGLEVRFDLLRVVAQFTLVAGGGILVGLLFSAAIARVISSIDDYLIEVTLTLVAAYGSYLLAEELGVSGVLAVVAAGLVSGNLGPRGMSPTTRLSLANFWELAAFLANSVVFLLIGLVINIEVLLANWQAILLAILAVLLARAVVIYLYAWWRPEIPNKFVHVVFWGGLRGAISLALALSITSGLHGEGTHLNEADAILIQSMAFGVVLFTILVQGMTMRRFIQRLRLSERSPVEEEYERRQARAVAAQASYEHIRGLRAEGLVSDHAWALMEGPMRRQIEARSDSVRELLRSDRTVEVAGLNNAYREALRAQRSTFQNLLASGVISEETFSYLVSEIDSALANDEINYGDLLLLRSKDKPPITRLVSAVVNEVDLEDTLNTLNILGIPTTRVSSSTSPGEAATTTLLMGIETLQEEDVIQAVLSCCSPPTPQPALGHLLPQLAGAEAVLVNSDIYVLPVERYEEL